MTIFSKRLLTQLTIKSTYLLTHFKNVRTNSISIQRYFNYEIIHLIIGLNKYIIYCCLQMANNSFHIEQCSIPISISHILEHKFTTHFLTLRSWGKVETKIGNFKR
jgi:hypothetical protein